MAGESAAWRLDEVAEYDSVRELGNALIALLWARVESGDAAARRAIVDVRTQILAADAFSEVDVLELRRMLSRRIVELRG